MSYEVLYAEKTEEKDIHTFVSFNIATARSMNESLLKFIFTDEAYRKIGKAFIAFLKKAKKSGTVDCFATHSEFSTNSREAAFLVNKFPNIQKELNEKNECLIYVKI